ncbi:hypothetical protein BJX65DRAFT_27960 [Aspergillus insuetus]
MRQLPHELQVMYSVTRMLDPIPIVDPYFIHIYIMLWLVALLMIYSERALGL